MKSKIITNEKFIDCINEYSNQCYDIIIFIYTFEQWNDLSSHKYIDLNKVIDFDGSINCFEYNKCLTNNPNQKVILFGLGLTKECNITLFRKSIYNCMCNILKKSCKNICIYFDINCIPNKNIEQYVDNMVMICTLSNYNFDKYNTNTNSNSKKNKIIEIDYNFGYLSVLNQNRVINSFSTSRIMSKQTNNARNLINERGNVCNPDYIEQVCRNMSQKYSFNMKVIKGQQLLDERMNLFYSVGKGSRYEPRLILLEYYGNKKHKNIQYSLVGKGITFDTGGYHLKPKGSIENMYIDMSGSAVVLSVLRGLHQLNVPINVVVALCIAENVIDKNSYLPNDIYVSRKGYTVEISNTDAEGRLVMADSMTYVQDIYNPEILIDVATLTGGCITALGESIAGIFGNNQYLINKIIKSGNYKYERCWYLPILEEHTESLVGDESDLLSMGKFNGASASIAGAFLSKFINKNVKWVHIDIAGPSKLEYVKNWQYKSGTGFGVGLLLHYFINKYKINNI